MARPGRKRRVGVPRNENGDILTSHKDKERADRKNNGRAEQIAHFQRAKMIVDTIIRDQRLVSPLGRMLLLGSPRAITAQMFAAGDHALRILDTYDRVVLNVNRNPCGQPMADNRGLSTKEDPVKEVVERATKNFMRLERALGSTPIPGVASATKTLLRGADVSAELCDVVILGLSAIVKEFGFDEINDGDASRAARKYRFIGEEKLLEPIVLRK